MNTFDNKEVNIFIEEDQNGNSVCAISAHTADSRNNL